MAGTVVAALVLLVAAPTFPAGAAIDPGPGAGLGAAVPVANSTASAPANEALASASATSAPITMTLVSTSPVAPAVAPTDSTVTVAVTITNNTDTALTRLQIRGVRDSPIIRSSALDTMLAHPVPPADNSLTQPMPTTVYTAEVAAHSSAQFSYSFLASSVRQSGGVCLCQSGIYPIDLTAYAAGPTSSPAQVAWVQTYIVSAASAPATEQVSWLWPLIDRPHQLADADVFLNDDLASEIATGGRLDRALQTLEQVSAASLVTVVIDPQLIDELSQMSTGYRVQSGATTVAGSGSAAAAAWLNRLRTVLTTLPFTFTPYGDPAVNAVTAAHLSWSSGLSALTTARISAALGRLPTTANATVAWPPGETLTTDALGRLALDGTTTVVLNDSTLAGAKNASPALSAVAPVAVAGQPNTTMRALVTSSALEQRVNGLLAAGGSQLAQLPALLAELALPALQTKASPSFVVLTPDRYVDASPATAAAVITSTAQSSWSQPIAAATAAATITPTDHGNLVPPDTGHYGGSTQLIAAATNATAFVTEFSSALAPSDQATVLGSFPAAIAACQSAAWGVYPTAANTFDGMLAGLQASLSGQVQIVRPANGSYSLASSSAPLLISIANNLSVPVSVRITMSSVGGVAGFRTDDAGVQTIPAASRRTIKVQAHVSRSGHFRVEAVLLMPAGAAFGAPLPLTIYSSALGTIGVIITVVAAAVLLLALVYRFVRRWRHHRDLIRRVMAEQQQVLAGTRG